LIQKVRQIGGSQIGFDNNAANEVLPG
jgi:hypothetical protein